MLRPNRLVAVLALAAALTPLVGCTLTCDAHTHDGPGGAMTPAANDLVTTGNVMGAGVGASAGILGQDLDGAVLSVSTQKSKYVVLSIQDDTLVSDDDLVIELDTSEQVKVTVGDDLGVGSGHEWRDFGSQTSTDTLQLTLLDLDSTSNTVNVEWSHGTVSGSETTRAYGVYDAMITDPAVVGTSYIGQHPSGKRLYRLTVAFRGRMVEFTLRGR